MASLTSTLTIGLIDNVSKPARTVAQALKDAERAAEQVGKGLAGTGASDRLSTSLAKLKANAKDVEQVAAALRDFAKAEGLAADKSTWTKTQLAAFRQFETQAISSLRAVKREEVAFNRSIATAMGRGGFGSNIAAGMSSVGATELARLREGRRLSAGMSAAGASANSSKVQQAEARARAEAEGGGTSLIPLGGGLLPMVAGYGAYEAGSHLIHAGVERQHVRVGMQNAGLGPDELKRAEAAAVAATKGAPNLSATQIMELFKETRSAVQHPEETFKLIPDLAKAASVLKGAGIENANIADIVKSGESLGLMNNPKLFHAFLEGQVKSLQVFGRTISTEQIYEAAKYSKSAGATLSDDFLNTTLPSLIQEMHGSSAGDALAMLTKTLRGGIQNKHIPVQKLNEIGLLEDPSKIKKNKAGQIMGYGGKVVGDDLLASNPRKWVQEIFKPAAEAHGYNTLSDQVRLLNQTLPGTAANLVRILIQQEASFKAHAENIHAATGLDAAVGNQTKDAKAASMELKAAIDDLGAAVAASPSLGSGLHSLAEGIRATANILSNPEAGGGLPAAEARAKKIAEEQGRKATIGDVIKELLHWKDITKVASDISDKVSSDFTDKVPDKEAKPWLKDWNERREANKKFFADPSVINAAPTFAAPAIGLGGLPHLPDQSAPPMGMRGGIAPNRAMPAFLQMEAWNPTLDIVGLKSKGLESEKLGDEMKERLSFTAMPMVDTSHFEQAEQAADKAKTAVEQLNLTVTPNVDSSSLDALLPKIDAAHSKLRAFMADFAKAQNLDISLGSHDTRRRGHPSGHRLEGLLGKVQRGDFSTGGVQGD